jgi:predicted Zn-dependent protease
MRLGIEALVAILRSLPQVHEWVVVETATRRMRRTLLPDGAAEVVGHRLSVFLFRDLEAGRGAARVDLASSDEEGAARAMLAAAADQAALAVGPGWVLPPPAAPARVEVADPELIGNLAGVVGEAFRPLARSGLARAEFTAELATHRIASSHEFASEYQETRLAFDLTLAGDGAGERVRGAVRRLRDVRLAARVARAVDTARLRRLARALEPGSYDLVLGPEAIAMPRYGWFAPIVAQAAGQRVRLGLSRYRPGQRVFAPGAGDGFTLVSDGTIPFGILSAPFGALGEPVRRFVLVDGGVAVDRALDLREAALASLPPNGGARNLLLAPGAESAAALATPSSRPLLVVRELAWLDADPESGDLTAEIALAALERPGAASQVVNGGLLSGNAFELLGRARLSRESGEAGWYRGPQALRIDRVDVVR